MRTRCHGRLRSWPALPVHRTRALPAPRRGRLEVIGTARSAERAGVLANLGVEPSSSTYSSVWRSSTRWCAQPVGRVPPATDLPRDYSSAVACDEARPAKCGSENRHAHLSPPRPRPARVGWSHKASPSLTRRGPRWSWRPRSGSSFLRYGRPLWTGDVVRHPDRSRYHPRRCRGRCGAPCSDTGTARRLQRC
jgi:hypothetical protein